MVTEFYCCLTSLNAFKCTFMLLLLRSDPLFQMEISRAKFWSSQNKQTKISAKKKGISESTRMETH